jgi:hypothetical protein
MLPEKEKSALLRETWARRGILLCVLLGGVALLGILLLAPSYVLVKTEHARIQRELLETQQAITGKGGAEDELREVVARLESYRQKGEVLHPRVTELARTVFRHAGDTIQISSFSFIRDSERAGIILSGVGATRESLLEFQKNMKIENGVKDAKFTESFITKKVDIRFTLTVTLE